MRIYIFLIALCSLLVSCSKDMESGSQEKQTVLLNGPRLVPRPIPKWPLFATCVQSYDHLVELMGNPSFAVSKVILENNQEIAVGGNLVSITYRAENRPEDFSLFRSQLQVLHTYYGNLQSNYSDVWTLGCSYTDAAIPPFTNILYKNRQININTAFGWSAPPYATSGLRIKCLVVE